MLIQSQRLRCWISATVLLGLLSAGPLFGQALTNKVLIIGIDGTMPSALAVARTTNLNTLRSNGCFSDRAITHPVTHSAACWSSFFTGVWGDKHGVNDSGNSFAGNQFAAYPNFMRRLETVNSNWNTVAFTRWADLVNVLGGTDGVTNFASDAAITTATCRLLTNGNPDVLYTILLDVDTAGHDHGWGATSTEYVREIEVADGRVGQIINALTNRVSYSNENWLVIILSDHGRHDSTMEQSRITFHLVWGRSAARGTLWPSPGIVDACPTVLTHMGVPIDPAWNLDGRVEGVPLPPPAYGTNLIFNGDAEFNSGTNHYGTGTNNAGLLNITPNRGIAWWFDPYPMTLAQYEANPRFPTAASPGPTVRGNNFFLAGLGATGIISQAIDVSALAGDIDDPGTDYVLSGFLGGAGTNPASMRLIARFLDETNRLLGTNAIGPVTAADRTNVTGLLPRSATGRLPASTRLIEFVLSANSPGITNDASADNLSFVLSAVPEPTLVILRGQFASGDWQVEFDGRTNRLYTLARSGDFEAWTDVSPTLTGTGARMVLRDTNAPPGQAFYRVRSRKP